MLHKHMSGPEKNRKLKKKKKSETTTLDLFALGKERDQRKK